MERIVKILDRARSEAITPDTVFKAVCMYIAENTGANRISIWHFAADDRSILCDCFYDVDSETFTEGQVLQAENHPTYFETILTENVIIAPDARSHPVTKELTEPYFLQHDIYSLLDFVIHDNFKPSGVICCENAGARRDWSYDDVSSLRQVSTLISFYFRHD